jgi:mannose-6-phosphate isomerase-like protein (cupin superfamily)
MGGKCLCPAGNVTVPNALLTKPIHLGLGATAVAQPDFTGMDWYADYAARSAPDGKEGRLVSLYTFAESWDSWEMHPEGHEVVFCTAGQITLHQEMADGSEATVALGPGEYTINPAGVWHTADVDSEATALFITAGLGTQHRPR